MTGIQELVVELPSGTSAPRVARRALEEVLEKWNLDDLEDELELLVSELTTNALLHAGGATEMRLMRLARGVRVEICDPSRLLPQRRKYDEDATTGRGLALVAAVASRAGVRTRANGKCIWFEIDRGGPGEGEALIGEDHGEESLAGCAPVRLTSLPVALYCASQQQIETLLREITIEAWTESSRTDPRTAGSANAAHSVIVGLIERQIELPGNRRRDRIDIDISVPLDIGDGARALGSILDAAEVRAAAGELLGRPTLPEVRALRGWYLGEIEKQLRGGEPQPWTGTTLIRGAGEQLPPISIDWDELGIDRSAAVVAGDEGNRIVAVTPAAAEVLGWDAHALVGERIATIVPPQLREQHLAGFTRFLATGEPRLLGRVVAVPALRADGSEVAVELHLESRSTGEGRVLFLAWLRPRGSDQVQT